MGLRFLETGNLELLSKPNHAIVFATTAKRFFGNNWSVDKSPKGIIIWLNEGSSYILQGMYEDIQAVSHMAADFVVSYFTLTDMIGPVMENAMRPISNFDYNYIQLKKGTDVEKTKLAINQS